MMKIMSVASALAFACGIVLSMFFEASLVMVIPVALMGLALEAAFAVRVIYESQPHEAVVERTDNIRTLAAISCN